MRRRSSAVLLVMSAGICMARAQTAPVERRTPQPLEPWPQVGLDVRIVDRGDAPVTGVLASQVSVREDGKAVSGATLTAAEGEPQSVCLVLDRSGSTYPDRDAIGKETAALVRAIPANDELCLVTFQAEPRVDVPLTMNHGEVAGALRYGHISGGSALLDALETTAAELQAHGRFRSQVIVLIGDGGENASSAKWDEVERDFAETGAPAVFAVMTEDKTTQVRTDVENKKSLMGLIEDTGGMAFEPKMPADRQGMIDSLVRLMSARYRLVYTTPAPLANGGEHRVRVGLSKDLAKQKMSVMVPRRYYAPGH